MKVKIFSATTCIKLASYIEDFLNLECNENIKILSLGYAIDNDKLLSERALLVYQEG